MLSPRIATGLAATLILGLSSCKLTQQTIDFSVFADAVIPPQNDDVMVEAGRGLPEQPSATATAQVNQAPLTAPATALPETAARSYKVQKGDTLSSIARAHKVTLAALYATNGLSETNSVIRDGQTLIIPAPGQTMAVAASPQVSAPAATHRAGSYTVATGDTLSSIARRHGISTAALIQANGLTSETADKIRIGQTIIIPPNNQ